METVPILRFELQGMRHILAIALHEYAVKMDEDIQRAITAACTPENLIRVISAEVQSALNSVVREEVEHFFRSGGGRDAVRHAIKKELTGEALED